MKRSVFNLDNWKINLILDHYQTFRTDRILTNRRGGIRTCRIQGAGYRKICMELFMRDSPGGLELLFGEGAEWPSYSGTELAVFFLSVILVIFVVYAFANMYISRQKKREHIRNLFLHKSRDAGLTIYQHKILNSIASLISPENPLKLFQYQAYFEKVIPLFMNYVIKHKETPESFKKITKEIVVINERLFYPQQYRKPLESVSEIDRGGLAVVYLGNEISLGRIILTDPHIVIKLLSRLPKPAFTAGMAVELYFWRSGDAEYKLPCKILSFNKGMLELSPADIPERGEEERLPLITTFIPCVLIHIPEPEPEEEPVTEAAEKDDEKEDSFAGRLIRINLDEFEAQTARSIESGETYLIRFTVSGFDIEVETKALHERSLMSDSYNIASFRVEKITDAERNILRDYILERLSPDVSEV